MEAGQADLLKRTGWLESGQSKLEDRTRKLWSGTSEQRGIRYEKGATRAIGRWLDRYGHTHNQDWQSARKQIGSDRFADADGDAWATLRNEYGIPNSDAARLRDFLVSVVWTRGTSRSPSRC